MASLVFHKYVFLLLAAQMKSVLLIHLFEKQSALTWQSFLNELIGHLSKSISPVDDPKIAQNIPLTRKTAIIF